MFFPQNDIGYSVIFHRASPLAIATSAFYFFSDFFYKKVYYTQKFKKKYNEFNFGFK